MTTGDEVGRDDPDERHAGGQERGWDDFAPLYDEHHERLYRVALLLCHGEEALAQDAVAETFVRIFPAWAEDHVDNFFAHARQTLVAHVMRQDDGHAIRARAARSRRRDARPERSIDVSLANATTTFRLLERLPGRQRTVVVLRYFEDLSYDQIASMVGETPAEAKAEVAVGLQRLRELMDEEGSAR